MIHQTLEKHFGFNEFKAGQKEVINRIVSGQSAAAIFPTGSGKSLCYQLPALHLPHLTLVVSPLLVQLLLRLRLPLVVHAVAAASAPCSGRGRAGAVRGWAVLTPSSSWPLYTPLCMVVGWCTLVNISGVDTPEQDRFTLR